MRIESGLSSYSYQSRHVPNTVGSEDAAPETAATPTGRATGASTFSSTLLSTQLATALWTVEGSRSKAGVQIGDGQNGESFQDVSRMKMVEAAYREYDVATPYDEF